MFAHLIGAAALAFVASLTACRALISIGPLDAPDGGRKDQVTATPTSGGLAVAAGLIVGFTILLWLGPNWRTEFLAPSPLPAQMAAITLSVVAVVGAVDDVHALSAKLKFVLFTAASLAAAWGVGVVDALPLGGGIVLHVGFVIGLSGSALWVFTLMNSVNFMDGSNGLAMGSMAIGFCVLGALGFSVGVPGVVALSLIAIGALLGFLLWNFPAGLLFAGDSGSLMMGAAAALTSLVLIRDGGVSPFVPPIIFFPLLADVLVTLAWRAWRRHSLFDGHSQHLYQIARHAGMSHAEVAAVYWAAMLMCGGVAYLVSRENGAAPWIALAIMSLIAIGVSAAMRRFADRRGIGGV